MPGRRDEAVQHRRRALGMRFFHVEKRREWTPFEEALLGTDTDEVLVDRAKDMRANPGINEHAFVNQFNDMFVQSPE